MKVICMPSDTTKVTVDALVEILETVINLGNIDRFDQELIEKELKNLGIKVGHES